VKDLCENGATPLVSMRAAKLCTVCVRVERPGKSATTVCCYYVINMYAYTLTLQSISVRYDTNTNNCY